MKWNGLKVDSYFHFSTSLYYLLLNGLDGAHYILPRRFSFRYLGRCVGPIECIVDCCLLADEMRRDMGWDGRQASRVGMVLLAPRYILF